MGIAVSEIFLRGLHAVSFSGLLNPLDSPHHVRMDEASKYREGVVLARPTKPGRGSFVNCGMRKVRRGVVFASRWRASAPWKASPTEEETGSVLHLPRMQDTKLWAQAAGRAADFG